MRDAPWNRVSLLRSGSVLVNEQACLIGECLRVAGESVRPDVSEAYHVSYSSGEKGRTCAKAIASSPHIRLSL